MSYDVQYVYLYVCVCLIKKRLEFALKHKMLYYWVYSGKTTKEAITPESSLKPTCQLMLHQVQTSHAFLFLQKHSVARGEEFF